MLNRSDIGRLPGIESTPELSSKSVFVVGNGPSLNQHDLDELVGIPSFAANAIYLIFERTNWRPDHYSCVDTVVLPDRKEEISHWIDQLRDTLFFFPYELYTHGCLGTPVHVENLIEPRPNVRFFKTQTLNLNGPQENVFSLPTDKFIVEPMTVTITLMQLAVKLGAKRIFLIGCDTEYKIPDRAKVLDKDDNRVDKRIVLDEDNDPNHFDPRYFGKGKLWHTPNTDLMLEHYEKAYEICKANGIEVFNAGFGGMLEVFPRVSFAHAVEVCRERK